jgi:hypothetical protein
MFSRQDIRLMSNPVCNRAADVSAQDFQYYDKDGFELNQAEQKFYSAMKYPIDYPILNHRCWQEPWFKLERDDLGLILDHCAFLCRANYSGEAQHQLERLRSTVPTADYLLRTRAKWGFDFALDAVAEDGTMFEVLHVEYDSNDYEHFKNRMILMEYTIRHTDWQDAADRIWTEREQWLPLKGFAQNDWKAEYLLGWNKCEYTEKAV